jgi:hypothetical protein
MGYILTPLDFVAPAANRAGQIFKVKMAKISMTTCHLRLYKVYYCSMPFVN